MQENVFHLVCRGFLRHRDSAFTKSMLESARNCFQVSHAASALRTTSKRFLTPVVYKTNAIRSTFKIQVRCDRDRIDLHLRILAAGYPQDAQVLFWMW